MRRLVVAWLALSACSEERPRRVPAPVSELPATADLGPVSAFEPVLRQLCRSLDSDPCLGCDDRASGGRVSVYCDQQQPPHVTHLQIYAGSPQTPLRDGILSAVAYLAPIMTPAREQKLRHMARHVSEDNVPPLTDPDKYWLHCYSVDGLVVDVSTWFRASLPMIAILGLSQTTARCVEAEWTVDKVPKRSWKRAPVSPPR